MAIGEFVAPCGHPGEPIIGTYVRCTHGCDGGPKVQSDLKRVRGHKHMCDCLSCETRRATNVIEFGTANGWVYVAWNGEPQITTDMPFDGPIVGYRLWSAPDPLSGVGNLVSNCSTGNFKGMIVLTGTCHYRAFTGEIILNVEHFFKDIGLA